MKSRASRISLCAYFLPARYQLTSNKSYTIIIKINKRTVSRVLLTGYFFGVGGCDLLAPTRGGGSRSRSARHPVAGVTRSETRDPGARGFAAAAGARRADAFSRATTILLRALLFFARARVRLIVSDRRRVRPPRPGATTRRGAAGTRARPRTNNDGHNNEIIIKRIIIIS